MLKTEFKGNKREKQRVTNMGFLISPLAYFSISIALILKLNINNIQYY